MLTETPGTVAFQVYICLMQKYMCCRTCVIIDCKCLLQLDGFIARNFKNQISVLGSVLDPLADKLLVTVLTVSMTAVGLVPCKYMNFYNFKQNMSTLHLQYIIIKETQCCYLS